jgi:DNA (cytosine-5)-methyltransferase 1
VLRARFPEIPVALDVRKTDDLLATISPASDLLTAGFPCTDFSQAGTTKGFEGGRSSLIIDTLALLKQRRFANVLLENVPNWRQLHRGAYMRHVVNALEAMGYRWAYRTIDSRAFGLPQRRLRLFLFATLQGDPRDVLFHGDEAPDQRRFAFHEAAHGFYWTEGRTGIGWGEDCVPTLKGGSSISIPSPPAIVLTDGHVITPDIRDCERLQGLPAGWTDLDERCDAVGGGKFKQRRRWVLVGNAINVEVAKWIGERLIIRMPVNRETGAELPADSPWPSAAWFDGTRRYSAPIGSWPVRRPAEPLEAFLRFPGKPLSLRATRGFHKRILASSLRFKPGFVDLISLHAARMEGSGIDAAAREPLPDAA